MNSRILRKILKNKNHPRRAALFNQLQRDLENYARGYCRRLGIDEEKWGSTAIKFTDHHRLFARYI